MATAQGAYATAALLKARAGISDSTDDTVLGAVCDQVNAYIEGPQACGRVLAPVASAVYLFDGDGGHELLYPKGVRSVSKLEVQWYTNSGTWLTIPTTDYRVRPSDADLPPGWPGNRIVLVDVPLGGIGAFPAGYDTVRATMTTGFAAIPDDVTDVALTAATRAWHSVQAGQTDIVGTDEMGRPLVSRFFSSRDMATLRAYSVNLP